MKSRLEQAKKFSLLSKEILRYVGESVMLGRTVEDPWLRRRKRIKLIQKYARKALKVLNVEVQVEDAHNYLLKDNALLVCNHMSYLDILVLSSVYPSCYVTSLEMKHTPVLGQLCDLGACVYVDRKTKKNLGKEIGEITQALTKGLNVCFFPEATSHNGEELLRFRKPLFNAARYAHKNILPVSLNYLEIDGESFSIKNRDKVCWYGDMDFLPHLWELCRAKKLVAKLKFLAPLNEPQSYHSRDLAIKTQEILTNEFQPAL